MNVIQRAQHFFHISRFFATTRTYAHIYWPKPNPDHAFVVQIDIDEALPPTGRVEVFYCAESKKMTIVARHVETPLVDSGPVASTEEADGQLESHFSGTQSRFTSM